jgi:hypothetical protein
MSSSLAAGRAAPNSDTSDRVSAATTTTATTTTTTTTTTNASSSVGSRREQQARAEQEAAAAAPHSVRITLAAPRAWLVAPSEGSGGDAYEDVMTVQMLPSDCVVDVQSMLSDALPFCTRVRLSLADHVALEPSLQIGALAAHASVQLSPFRSTRLYAKRAQYDVGAVVAHVDRFVHTVDVVRLRVPDLDPALPNVFELVVSHDAIVDPDGAAARASLALPDTHFDVLGVVDKAGKLATGDFYPPFGGDDVAGTKLDVCVRLVVPSSHNPPSRARAAAGDLLYFDVVLGDGNQYVGVTATRSGFFANRSIDQQHFNAEPRADADTSPFLWSTLARHAPTFRARLLAVLQARAAWMSHHSSGGSAAQLRDCPAVFVAPPARETTSAVGALVHEWRAATSVIDAVASSVRREVLAGVYVAPQQGELQVMRAVRPRTYRDALLCDKFLTQLHLQATAQSVSGAEALENGTSSAIDSSATIHNGSFVTRVLGDVAFDDRSRKVDDADPAVRRDAAEHAQRVAEKVAGNEIRVLRFLSHWQRPIPQLDDEEAAAPAAAPAAADADAAKANADGKSAFIEKRSDDPDAPHTITACVVDWCGRRYQVQPSISETLFIDPERSLVYGQLLDEEVFAPDNDAALAAARTVADRLYVKPLTIESTDADGVKRTRQLPLGSFVKGVRGSDNRLYFLELGHTLPADTLCPDDPSAKHRPELIQAMHRYNAILELQRKKAEAVAAAEAAAAAKAAAGQEKPAEEPAKEAQPAKEAPPAKEGAADVERETGKDEAAAKEAVDDETAAAAATTAAAVKEDADDDELTTETMTDLEISLRAQHDIAKELASVWTRIAPTIRSALTSDQAQTATPSSEELLVRNAKPSLSSEYFGSRKASVADEDRAALEALSEYLKQVALPRTVERLLTNVPIDGDELCDTLHENGVPLRHLVLVLQFVSGFNRKSPHDGAAVVIILCIEEMIVRAAKQCFKVYMQSGRRVEDALNGVEPHAAVADFVNCFLGTGSKAGGSAAAAAAAAADVLTPEALWAQLRARVKAHFRFAGPMPPLDVAARGRLLRAFARRVGLQLRTQTFKFSTDVVIKTRDIVRIYPLVKAVKYRAALGDVLLEQARTWRSMAFAEQGVVVEDAIKSSCNFAQLALTHANQCGDARLTLECQDLLRDLSQLREEVYRKLGKDVKDALMTTVAAHEKAVADQASADVVTALELRAADLSSKYRYYADEHVFAAMQCVDQAQAFVTASERTNGPLHYTTVRAYEATARALADANRVAAACEVQRRAVYLLNLLMPQHPELPGWLSTYAEILFACNRTKLALEYGQLAIALDEDSPTLLWQQIQRWARLQDYQKLLSHAQRFLELTKRRAERDPNLKPEVDAAEALVKDVLAKAISARKEEIATGAKAAPAAKPAANANAKGSGSSSANKNKPKRRK